MGIELVIENYESHKGQRWQLHYSGSYDLQIAAQSVESKFQ